jgi:RNA polymerase sigma factor (sigma-70 family)
MASERIIFVHCLKCDRRYGLAFQLERRLPVADAKCPGCPCAGWSILPKAQVDELVTGNLGLVPYMVNRVCRRLDRGTMLRLNQDLYAIGRMALYHAASRFDTTLISQKKGAPVAFSTYASIAIKQWVWRAIIRDLRRCRREQQPTLPENGHHDDDWESDWTARFVARVDADPANLAADAQGDACRTIFAQAGLDRRERAIVHRRIVGGETLRGIAKSYKLTYERIRQIEVRALKKLKRAAEAAGVNSPC